MAPKGDKKAKSGASTPRGSDAGAENAAAAPAAPAPAITVSDDSAQQQAEKPVTAPHDEIMATMAAIAAQVGPLAAKVTELTKVVGTMAQSNRDAAATAHKETVAVSNQLAEVRKANSQVREIREALTPHQRTALIAALAHPCNESMQRVQQLMPDLKHDLPAVYWLLKSACDISDFETMDAAQAGCDAAIALLRAHPQVAADLKALELKLSEEMKAHQKNLAAVQNQAKRIESAFDKFRTETAKDMGAAAAGTANANEAVDGLNRTVADVDERLADVDNAIAGLREQLRSMMAGKRPPSPERDDTDGGEASEEFGDDGQDLERVLGPVMPNKPNARAREWSLDPASDSDAEQRAGPASRHATKKLRVPKPNVQFSGQGNLQPEDALFAIENYLRANGEPQASWAQYAPSFLEGTALSLWSKKAQVLEKRGPIPWSAFRSFLKSYAHPDKQRIARNTLMFEMQQGGRTVRAYHQAFEQQMYMAGDPTPSDLDLILAFQRGLSPDLAQKCRADPSTGEPFTDFTRFVRFAQSMDDSHRSHRAPDRHNIRVRPKSLMTVAARARPRFHKQNGRGGKRYSGDGNAPGPSQGYGRGTGGGGRGGRGGYQGGGRGGYQGGYQGGQAQGQGPWNNNHGNQGQGQGQGQQQQNRDVVRLNVPRDVAAQYNYFKSSN